MFQKLVKELNNICSNIAHYQANLTSIVYEDDIFGTICEQELSRLTFGNLWQLEIEQRKVFVTICLLYDILNSGWCFLSWRRLCIEKDSFVKE